MASEAVFGFRKEPVIILAAIRALILLAVSYGLKATPDQIVQTMLTAEALLAMFTRSQVTSETTLQKANLSSVEVAAMAAKNERTTGPGGTAMVMVLCYLLAGSIAILPACASRDGGTVAPDTATLDIGGDILNVTADFQSLVNDYARQNGTNNVTDAIKDGIETKVLPAARRTRELVNSYHVLSDPNLKASKAAEVEASLQALLNAYADVSKSADVSALAAQFNTASTRVRALVAQIRAEIARAKG